MDARVPMTRADLHARCALLQIGQLLDVCWRYSETPDVEASEWFSWRGEVIDAAPDPQGILRILVEYAVGSVGLEEGGALFLPAHIDGRITEIFSVNGVRRPFVRPAIVPVAPLRRPRDEAPPGNPLLDVVPPLPPAGAVPPRGMMNEDAPMNARDFGEAIRGEDKKITLAPGFRVLAEVPKRFSWAFPHLWLPPYIGAPRESFATCWANFKDLTAFQLSDTPIGEDHAKELQEAITCFSAVIERAVRPASCDDWIEIHLHIKRIIGVYAFVKGGYEEERRVKELAQRQLDVGSWDAVKLLGAVQKKSTRTPTGRGGRGTWYGQTQRGRGAWKSGRGGRGAAQSNQPAPTKNPAPGG